MTESELMYALECCTAASAARCGECSLRFLGEDDCRIRLLRETLVRMRALKERRGLALRILTGGGEER